MAENSATEPKSEEKNCNEAIEHAQTEECDPIGDKKEFCCPYCEKSYSQNPRLITHKKCKHVDKLFQCTIEMCTFTAFYWQKVLSHQIRVHFDMKCPLDNTHLQTDGGVTSHVRLHTENSEMPNNIVFLGENDQQYLDYISTVVDKKPFVCTAISGCPFTTKYKQTLTRHEANHRGEKPLRCDVVGCDFATAFPIALSAHKQNKHGQFLFCGISGCPYTTRDQSNMNFHKRSVHEKKKPHCCTLCVRSFCSPGSLRTHMISIHERAKPFACPFPDCDYANAQKSNLTTHIEGMHSEDAVKHRKNEEERVSKLLMENGIKFEENRFVALNAEDGKIRRAVVDFVIANETCVFLLEVDERQHNRYDLDYEVSRMYQVRNALVAEQRDEMLGKKIVWIRYNPHAFNVNGAQRGRHLSKEKREARLLQVLTEFQAEDDDLSMNLIYMYYDTTIDEKTQRITLSLFSEEAFDAETKKLVVDTIVDISASILSASLDVTHVVSSSTSCSSSTSSQQHQHQGTEQTLKRKRDD